VQGVFLTRVSSEKQIKIIRRLRAANFCALYPKIFRKFWLESSMVLRYSNKNACKLKIFQEAL